MNDLLETLAAHRRRIRGARAADAALRAAFYASVAGGLALLLSKLAGVSLPLALAAGVLGAVPAAVAAREWARAFSIRDCAIYLDRLLGLDERLSTAIEAPGAMGPVLLADAAGALTRTPLPPRRLPREGKLLAGSLVLLAVLFTIPSPGRSGATGDPSFEALTAAEAEKLLALANVDVQFEELAEEAAKALRDGHPEAAVVLLDELKKKLTEYLLAGGSEAKAQPLLDQAASTSAAVSAELARLGRTIHAPPPAAAQAKLERQKAVERAAEAAAAPILAGAPARTVHSDGSTWNPRYDPVLRRYFGREP